MKRLTIAAVGLALVGGMAVYGGPLVGAQGVASIALPPPRGNVQLYPGCNNVALSFPDGTDSQTVVQAVTPAGLVQAMWRHDAAQNRFEGFSPAAPQASDLLAVNLWDPVWLCVAGIAPPSPPPATAPTATPVPPPPTALTPIVFENSDWQFHLDTGKFRVDWTADLAGGLGLEGTFSVMIWPKGGLPVPCMVEASGLGVKSGTEECSGGPGNFEIQVMALFVDSWRLTITPLAD